MRLTIRNFVLGALTVGVLCMCQNEQAVAQLTYSQIQRVARDAIRLETVLITRPRIEIDGDILHWELGEASWGYAADSDSEFRPFLDAQLQIELIRHYRSNASQRVFWRPYLARAEGMIATAVAKFIGTESEEQKSEAIEDLWQYETVLVEARDEYAAQKGVNVSRGDAAQKGGAPIGKLPALHEMLVEVIRGSESEDLIEEAEYHLATFRTSSTQGNREAAEQRLFELMRLYEEELKVADNTSVAHNRAHMQEKWGLKVNTIPTGANVWLMPVLEATLASLERRPPRWTELSQTEKVPLAGAYFYYLKWDLGASDRGASGVRRTKIGIGSEVTLNGR